MPGYLQLVFRNRRDIAKREEYRFCMFLDDSSALRSHMCVEMPAITEDKRFFDSG